MNRPLREPAEVSIEFRDELLAQCWPDDTQLARLTGAAPWRDLAAYAAGLRAAGKILGVWSAAQEVYRHPDFQFDATGRVRAGIADLLAQLPGAGDRGGWRQAFWLYSPHALLGGRLPAEIFPENPARVIEVARREFADDRDACW